MDSVNKTFTGEALRILELAAALTAGIVTFWIPTLFV